MSSNVADPAPARRIDRRLVLVLAAASGVAAANLYYAQPLLPAIADRFDAGSGTAGLILTLSQLGYAAGIALLVPLGDLLDRRKLVPAVLAGTAVALLAAAVAPTIGFLIAVAALIGFGSVVTHVLFPLAAELAGDEERGRVVGTLMTGLLVGVLLGRTAAGFIADVAGWRSVYVAGAALMVMIALGLRRELPADRPRPKLPYRHLLRSTVRLFRTEPVLRLRCLYGFLSFATFSTFWTSVAFLLAGPPYHYGDAAIGLFGLIGAAGAASATVAGRLADRGLNRLATGAFAATTAVSYAVVGIGRNSLAAMIVGIVALDVGATGVHVLNQHTNYSLPVAADSRSRINAAYVTIFFLGGAAGSAASAAAYSRAGWTGVSLLGTGLATVLTLLWMWKGGAGEGWRATRPVLE